MSSNFTRLKLLPGQRADVGTVNKDALLFRRDYYALTRHDGASSAQPGGRARLVKERVRLDVQAQMAAQLGERAHRLWPKADRIRPAFQVQPFSLADGALRYYVRAEWESAGRQSGNVVDLGHGRTGITVSVDGEDSACLKLLEYRDGLDQAHMRILQMIGSAE